MSANFLLTPTFFFTGAAEFGVSKVAPGPLGAVDGVERLGSGEVTRSVADSLALLVTDIVLTGLDIENANQANTQTRKMGFSCAPWSTDSW